jgi:Na+/H+ antiporter NhaD/arsenite permease-like protein
MFLVLPHACTVGYLRRSTIGSSNPLEPTGSPRHDPNGARRGSGMTGALVIFLITYGIIAARRLGLLRLSRPAAVWAGAGVCVLTGLLTPAQAYASIDGDTLVLLVAMMVFAAHLDHAGFFEWGAALALRVASTPSRFLTALVFSSGILSALLVNDAVVFLMAPLLVPIVRRLGLSPPLFLMALMTSANLGSVMTFVGSPQMMIVGSLSDMGFSRWFLAMAPLGIFMLFLNRILLPLFYPMTLAPTTSALNQAEWLDSPFDDADELPTGFRHTWAARIRPPLLLRCGIGLLLAYASFFAGLNVAWSALAAAALLLLVAGWAPRAAFKQVDWQLLLFVSGLFVVVGAVRTAGASHAMLDALHPWLGQESHRQAWGFALLTLLGANLVGNLPFVLVASDWLGELLPGHRGWFLLAMASSFAGNLFVTGSMVNVLVRDRARSIGHVGFAQHMRYGVVITLLSTAIGTAWVLLLDGIAY